MMSARPVTAAKSSPAAIDLPYAHEILVRTHDGAHVQQFADVGADRLHNGLRAMPDRMTKGHIQLRREC